MILDVAVLPRCAIEVERKVCLVVDLLRASNTILAMLEAGALEIELAVNPPEALRRAANDRAGTLVCGESGGIPPAGFDLGNSPVHAAERDFQGRRVIYATSNGTSALAAVANARAVFIAGLRNASAALQQAMAACQEGRCDLEIVCAGDDGATTTSLEDLFCAGYLVELLTADLPTLHPEQSGDTWCESIALDESAIVAQRLFRSYLLDRPTEAEVERSARRSFADARNGRTLASTGFESDLTYCARVNVSSTVPRLVVDPTGLKVRE